ncbi:MAG TPA: hypothetical protein VI259_07145, partial [Gemmatimonadaceae bacterium]
MTWLIRGAGTGGDQQHRNLAMPDHVFGDAPEHQSPQPALAARRHRDELHEIVADGIDDHTANIGRLDDANLRPTAARADAFRDGAETPLGYCGADMRPL